MAVVSSAWRRLSTMNVQSPRLAPPSTPIRRKHVCFVVALVTLLSSWLAGYVQPSPQLNRRYSSAASWPPRRCRAASAPSPALSIRELQNVARVSRRPAAMTTTTAPLVAPRYMYGAMAQQQVNTNGGGADATTVAYETFRLNFYKTSEDDIFNNLGPCGCAKAVSAKPLSSLGVQKDPIDLELLSLAESALLTLALELVTKCDCGYGINQLTVAINGVPAVTDADKFTPATTSLVMAMSSRVDEAVKNVMTKCCDATESTKAFTFVAGSMTYDQAIEDSRNRKGMPATIQNRADCWKSQASLRGQHSDLVDGTFMYAWIGLTSEEPLWFWANGQQLGRFQNWGANQPAAGKKCSAAVLSAKSGVFATWAAVDCALKLPYLLETELGASSSKAAALSQIVIIVIAVLLVLFLIGVGIVVARRFIPRLNPARTAPGERRTAREGPYQRRPLHGGRGGRGDLGGTEMTDVTRHGHPSDAEDAPMTNPHGPRGGGATSRGGRGGTRRRVVFHSRPRRASEGGGGDGATDGSGGMTSEGSTEHHHGGGTAGATDGSPGRVRSSAVATARSPARDPSPGVVSPRSVRMPSALRLKSDLDALQKKSDGDHQPPTITGAGERRPSHSETSSVPGQPPPALQLSSGSMGGATGSEELASPREALTAARLSPRDSDADGPTLRTPRLAPPTRVPAAFSLPASLAPQPQRATGVQTKALSTPGGSAVAADGDDDDESALHTAVSNVSVFSNRSAATSALGSPSMPPRVDVPLASSDPPPET